MVNGLCDIRVGNYLHAYKCVCVFMLKEKKKFLGRQTIVLTGSISLCSTNLVLIKRTVVDDGNYWCGVLLEEIVGYMS